MKKTLVLLPAILVIIFVVFSLIDSSDYVVEKKLWNIQHQITKVAQQGKMAPASLLEGLSVKTQKLIKAYPHSDLMPQMYMQLAQIYIFTKDFDKARTYYGMVLERFPEQKVICAKALIAIGSTFLAQNRGDDAISYYQIFINEHPDSLLNGGLKSAIKYLQSVKARQKSTE